MQLPTPVLRPGFNVTRASHVVLTVKDLAPSRRFYEEVIGLILTAEADGALYYRGIEESCHHSLVLRQTRGEPVCERVGLRALTEDDLEEIARHFRAHDCPAEWADVPHQGRTLHATDPVGTRLEICAHMPVEPREVERLVPQVRHSLPGPGLVPRQGRGRRTLARLSDERGHVAVKLDTTGTVTLEQKLRELPPLGRAVSG